MITISPSRIEGQIDAYSSKSEMQRAVLGAALSTGETVIKNPSYADDAKSSLLAAKRLGALVSERPSQVEITGRWNPSYLRGEIPCGESGLLSRMLCSIAALSPNEVSITGAGTLSSRKFEFITSPLARLGCEVSTTDGKLPIHIRGPLKGGDLYLGENITSQFLSGLLYTLPLCSEDSNVKIDTLVSKPYVHLTLGVLKKFGIEIETTDHGFLIRGQQTYKPASIPVEGDWSGASFFLVAGALAGKIGVRNLSISSFQGDKEIITLLKNAGANVKIEEGLITVESGPLTRFTFDATHYPDLVPPLSALAIGCEGESEITGISRIAFKESDRKRALFEELSALGAKIELVGDSIRIRGSKLKGGEATSHGDHRIAMTCGVLGLIADNGVSINGWESVSKSYPGFFKTLESLRT